VVSTSSDECPARSRLAHCTNLVRSTRRGWCAPGRAPTAARGSHEVRAVCQPRTGRAASMLSSGARPRLCRRAEVKRRTVRTPGEPPVAPARRTRHGNGLCRPRRTNRCRPRSRRSEGLGRPATGERSARLLRTFVTDVIVRTSAMATTSTRKLGPAPTRMLGSSVCVGPSQNADVLPVLSRVSGYARQSWMRGLWVFAGVKPS